MGVVVVTDQDEQQIEENDLSNYDDAEYLAWQVDAITIIKNDVDMMVLYIHADDMSSVAIWSKNLEDDCKDILSEIDSFKVSPVLSLVKDEIRLALIDYKLGGYWGRKGLEGDIDTYSLSNAIEYLESGNRHFDLASYYLDYYEIS